MSKAGPAIAGSEGRRGVGRSAGSFRELKGKETDSPQGLPKARRLADVWVSAQRDPF